MASTVPVTGYVVRFVTIPGTGEEAPTDNYDIVLNDANGGDLLNGGGANRDTSNTESVSLSARSFVDGLMTLVVANAGLENTGQVIVYVELLPRV